MGRVMLVGASTLPCNPSHPEARPPCPLDLDPSYPEAASATKNLLSAVHRLVYIYLPTYLDLDPSYPEAASATKNLLSAVHRLM